MKIFLRTALLPLVSFFGIQVASAATVDEFQCSIRIFDEKQAIVADVREVISATRRPVSSQEGIEMTEGVLSLTAKVPAHLPTPEEPPYPQPIPEPLPEHSTTSGTDDSTLTLRYRHALETNSMSRVKRAAQSLCFSASRVWKGSGEANACVGADSNPFAPNSYGWTKAGFDGEVVIFEHSQLRRPLVLGNPAGARSEFQCRFMRTIHIPSN